MHPLQVFLDTDIGGDVDDTLALALALQSPELELCGITTVSKDTTRRALLAREVVSQYASERVNSIPIVAGYSAPLSQKREARESYALTLLANQIKNSKNAGGRLTIVCIGPLTNLALLLQTFPELTADFEILMTAGYWSGDKAEWNIKCDPEAAAIVFESGVSLKMVGLDVTQHCILSDEQVAQFSQGTPRARFLNEQIKLWGRKVYLHDPLTILTLFSSCVKFKPMRIEIVLNGEKRACTLVTEGKSNAQVAVDVDANDAVQIFLQRILNDFPTI